MMMKNIKELELELIELEDQVLLVESKVGEGKLNDWVKLSVPKIERVEEWNEDLVGFCNKIIASTKPLEGLSLLVIEDAADEDFEKYKDEVGSRYSHSLYQFSKDRIQEGYNKAKETYKFTEDDLRKAMNFAFDFENYHISEQIIEDRYGIKNADLMSTYEAHDAFVKSLTKKELWIEVEGYNNQIKAVWK